MLGFIASAASSTGIAQLRLTVGKIWGDAFGKLGSQIVYVTPEGGDVYSRERRHVAAARVAPVMPWLVSYRPLALVAALTFAAGDTALEAL